MLAIFNEGVHSFNEGVHSRRRAFIQRGLAIFNEGLHSFSDSLEREFAFMCMPLHARVCVTNRSGGVAGGAEEAGAGHAVGRR